jgi:hypothetical protein
MFSHEQADHVCFSCIVFMYIITEVLSISGNFGGTLPSQLTGMKRLRYLDLNNCSLTGTIPWIFENMKDLGMPCLDKFSFLSRNPLYLAHYVIHFLNLFVLSAQGISPLQIINLLVQSHLPLGN